MKINIDLNLLEELTSDIKPLWGNMTAQHMVEHLSLAVKSSNTKIIFKECMNPPEKFSLLNRILLSKRPLPRDFVNTVIGKGLKPLRLNNLEMAKAELLTELNEFYKYFKENFDAKLLNATFGPLNFEEWIVFHNKHFTHHFTQFGLIKE
jgi:oxepin-CoA hydrolase / 3-oxo-5,6-dehydrosuberyl-CoA semialdehyde dehydrogenase